MKLKTPIETPRLLLRSYRFADRDFSISLWCDAENGRYMSDPLFENLDDRYLAYFDEMEDDPDGYYLIAQNKATGEPVGTCCIFPETDAFDIGYCIRKDLWKTGLGSELIVGMLDWIKAAGGTAVTAEVADENLASCALLKKFGFVPTTATRFKKRGEDRYFHSHIYRLPLDPS